ncbi:3-hydroxydecanoyl-ACP dehydratase [Thaumasiovibrio sp. DFM-14]|uniref:ApeP family dehydratase n=1 Tax=Thaumasiovibrio sp. DFM-14 TaxID=3384792 RepID=UPI00399FCF1F
MILHPKEPVKKLFSHSPEIETLLPHSQPMILIDKLIAFSAGGATAHATIDASNVYYQAGTNSVPAWIGLEMMAQTIAAKAGFEAWLNGQPPPSGMLLGTRRFQCQCPAFKEGQTLEVIVTHRASMGTMQQFHGEIQANGQLLAECDLNVMTSTEA